MLYLYSVFDRKAETYTPPFVSPADASAIRSFGDQVNNDKSPYASHPADFDLFLVGTFDYETGDVACLQSADPLFLVNGKSLLTDAIDPSLVI